MHQFRAICVSLVSFSRREGHVQWGLARILARTVRRTTAPTRGGIIRSGAILAPRNKPESEQKRNGRRGRIKSTIKGRHRCPASPVRVRLGFSSVVGWHPNSGLPASARKKKMSASARRKIAAAQRVRWAKLKAGKRRLSARPRSPWCHPESPLARKSTSSFRTQRTLSLNCAAAWRGDFSR